MDLIEKRDDRARAALATYRARAKRHGWADYREQFGAKLGESEATDLIADVLLFVDRNGLDASAVLRMATGHAGAALWRDEPAPAAPRAGGFIATAESRNFKFEGHGATETDALAALDAAFFRHGQQYELPAEWHVEAGLTAEGSITLRPFQPGAAYRDREELTA